MKHTKTPKPTRQMKSAAPRDSSHGSNATAIAPPAYGLDFVDHGHAAATSSFAPDVAAVQLKDATAPPKNRTGMPDQLKAGLEQLSGFDLSGVRVHYNSAKPAGLNAIAYTQGQDIHVGPRQERHLPHEGWHTVQQMQGRVKPTMQAKGVAVNDDAALEREADVMGAKAANKSPDPFSVSVLYKKDTSRKLSVSGGGAKVAQLGKAPKALSYTSYGGKRRKGGIKNMQSKQRSLGRRRRLHARHIIPHSDLQNWMLTARQTGNAMSVQGEMRRQIHRLLIFFEEGAEATNWQNAYNAYEAGPPTQSFLMANNATVVRIWRLIEWHAGNIFLGHGGINSAIQNRFDAGRGVRAFRGVEYINRMHAIWFAANTLLGLAPTAIQDTRIYSTDLKTYIIVRSAEHSNSRALGTALGWIGRSDYERGA